MKKIVFTGGGTAGHIMPNFALIDALKPEFNCVYMGGDGMEKQLCEKKGIEFFEIPTVKLRRDAAIKNFAVPFKLASCVSAAKKTLKNISPDLIFSKGGYAALPAVLAAKSLGIPLLAHESDLSPGIVTKLSKRRAKKILCAFEPCAENFKNGVYVGAPLRRELFIRRGNAKSLLGLDGQKPVLLVMGGSSGAAAINKCVTDALPELLKKFDIVHITGKNKRSGAAVKGYKPIEFCDDMPLVYSAADLCLTRAGANALAELIALNIPCLAVPLEKASRGDQKQNAEYYSKKNAVAVLPESDMDTRSLVSALESLYLDRDKYRSAMKNLRVDGTDRIVGIIKQCLVPGA